MPSVHLREKANFLFCFTLKLIFAYYLTFKNLMQKRVKPRLPIRKEAEHRINQHIRATQVRVVGENIEPGVYSLEEARKMAEELEVDLVEISPNADPPVCRLVDYNK